MAQEETETTYTIISQQVMDDMLREHEIWMRTGGLEGRRGNFREGDLRGCRLAGANFSGASLRGSCLRGMDLSGANFQEVDLAEAELTGVRALGVNFQRANFSNAKADMANFSGANLSFVNMLSCDLSGATLERAVMVQASMRQSILSSASFEGANLSQAILRESNLTDANLSKTNLEHADLRESNCTRTRLDGANLRETMMRGAELEGVSFIDTDFSHAVDVSPHYQMVAFQQRQEALEEDKRVLARDKERLAEREVAVLAEKRGIEMKCALYTSLKDEESKLQAELAASASRARFFLGIWMFSIAVFTGGLVLLASGIPLEKLNIFEIAVLFGVLFSVLLLFAMSAAIPGRAAKLLQRHMTLRDRKQSVHYNQEEGKSEQAHSAETSGVAA